MPSHRTGVVNTWFQPARILSNKSPLLVGKHLYICENRHTQGLGEGTVCYIKVEGTMWRKGILSVGMGEGTRGASERENAVVEYEVFE